MRPFHFALAVAALVACSPRFPAAQEVPSRWGAFSVEAVDEGGRTLPTFEHRGRTYVLGALGQRYLLRFRNGTAGRVEVVASVDGRDVIDGRPAALSKRGYVVDPRGELTIDGFRVSQEAVAAFRFSSVDRSYAARKGDARDVGVVGVAVFSERRPRPPPPPPYPPYPYPYPYDGVPQGSSGPSRDESRRSEAPREDAPPPSAAPAPAPEAGGIAQAPHAQKKAQRPGLGTEFGEEHASHVDRTTFVRASGRPDAVLTFRYDDRDGLVALGVDVDGRDWRRDETWRRETASPFRADASYCEPPPGWRAGVR